MDDSNATHERSCDTSLLAQARFHALFQLQTQSAQQVIKAVLRPSQPLCHRPRRAARRVTLQQQLPARFRQLFQAALQQRKPPGTGRALRFTLDEDPLHQIQIQDETVPRPGPQELQRFMGSKVGDTFNELSSAIVRVHTPETMHLPQVLLDTDARNEVDDQHYIAYGLFSNVDVLGINSAHHGPHRINHFGAAQEPINYGEILYIIELSRISGLLQHRTENQIPRAFRGAKVPLQVPVSGKWSDTQPIESEASEAILAAARGASPDNPVWVLPVGPCTNIASAILLARKEGLDLKSRIKIVWLGGGPERVNAHHNGGSDPWSVFVTGQSDVDFWIILEHPTGASITMDKRVESGLYPNNPLGQYLETITPAREKALFDVATISMVIGNHLGKPWLKLVEPAVVLGPDQKYRWKQVHSPTHVYIIRDIDAEAMKADFFNTLNGKPTALPPKKP